MTSFRHLHIGSSTFNLSYTPLIMGVLNLTPDSFSDGGLYINPEKAIIHAQELSQTGAHIIDIGAESTRPMSVGISLDEEWRRLEPVLNALSRTNLLISIDTQKSEIARRALLHGAHMINDISAAQYDPLMFKVVAQAQVPYVLMHMRGTPSTMQQGNLHYTNVCAEVRDFLHQRVILARQQGIKQVLIDPGIGFGKCFEDNLKLTFLIHQLNTLIQKDLACGIVYGCSRKTFISSIFQTQDLKSCDDTSALLSFSALLLGADIIRVHNPMACKKIIQIIEQQRKHTNHV